MLGNTNKRRGLTAKDSAVTILTSGCEFDGKLYCIGSSRIGGKVKGQIISNGILVIEESAIINANIKAEEVIIQGLVKGSLEANAKVELTETSRFDGDITSPVFIIKEGAQFNGKSSTSGSSERLDKDNLMNSLSQENKHAINQKEPLRILKKN